MVIIYRFQHTGKVCSGDYLADIEILLRDEELAEGNYDYTNEEYGKYFLYQEGKFFYCYVMAIALVSLSIILLACCFAGCMFMIGGATAVKVAEKSLKEHFPDAFPKEEEDPYKQRRQEEMREKFYFDEEQDFPRGR